jgi:phage baseplate assembly protein W
MTDTLLPLSLVNKDIKVTLDDVEILRTSITDLLSTQKGTIFGMAEYGCDIHKLRQNKLNNITAELGKAYIMAALKEYEKRARVLSIKYTIKGIALNYTIKMERNNGDNAQPINILFTINF